MVQQIGQPRNASSASAPDASEPQGWISAIARAYPSAAIPMAPRRICSESVLLANMFLTRRALSASIADQIFADQHPRAVNAGLDALAGQPEGLGDFVDRELLDIAQQDHLAIMLGQRLDGAGEINAKVFGPQMRQSRFRPINRNFRNPHRHAQQAKAGAPCDREYPSRERGHRPQRSDAPIEQQQRFLDGVVDISRPAIARGIAPDIGLGRRYQRHQGFLVAATRGFDQPGVAAPRFWSRTSWRR